MRAHSSQGGKAAGAVNRALGEGSVDDEEDQDTFEDQVNRIIESRRMLTNASYLAFTATPKNKTLEMFGIPDPQPDGKVRHLPFHNYTMKQAIEEGFIMDVLTNYTPVSRYFNVIKSIEDDPKFDSKRARSKLPPVRREPRVRHHPESGHNHRPLQRFGVHAKEDGR